ncbi:hypothetical protein POJ06DRAFT_84017 [Lipomyces tetrasporus]|uniref:TRIP4/RQT4 C2HC5-type zinc finger domain-containing protein n=1 Tax=Lipomyces tetrasporus TaxID=54092 RepID=A0AAD7VSD6_9ASCO|nr:uncharacterized protein POJ06DRAFT_84017 [Lipomyces tetrasporus]KAJ8100912.1 hypothetical protein POJ06DRAFT_84017 [Lipomyces tetrasporus]
MSSAVFEDIAARNLGNLLPLDEQTLKEIVHYAASLSGPDEAAEHFKGLLGHEAASLDFIHGFCSRRWPSRAKQRSGSGSNNGNARTVTKRAPVGAKKVSNSSGLAKPAPPASNTRPPDIGRGYMKKAEEDDYYVGVKKDKGKERHHDPSPQPTPRPTPQPAWTTTTTTEPQPEIITGKGASTSSAYNVKGPASSASSLSPSPAAPPPSSSRSRSPSVQPDARWSAPPPILANKLSLSYYSENAKDAEKLNSGYNAVATMPLEPVKVKAPAAPSSSSPRATTPTVPSAPFSPKKKVEGTLTSDLATKKSAKRPVETSGVGAALAGKNGQKSIKVHSLQEVENAIMTLESEYSSTNERRACNCQAQRHPLLEVAPNCLHCGKIICVREGLGPCTSCHTPLLTKEEYGALVSELRQERGQLKNEIYNDQSKKATTGSNARLTYSGSAGGQPITTDKAMLPGLDRANDQLSNLLSFQANSVQRTRIIDNASDFELPGSGSERWLTTAERAMQLRKQQRTMKQMEALDRKRNGRGKRVISIDLRGNKIVTEDHSETDFDSDEFDDIEEIDPNAALKEQTGAKVETWNPDKDNARFIKPLYPGLKGTEPKRNRTVDASTNKGATKQVDSDDEAMDIDNDEVQSATKLVTSSALLPPALKNYNQAINTDSRRSRPARVQEEFEYDDLASTRSLFDEIGITETVDEETTEAIAQANRRFQNGIRDSKYAIDRDGETVIRRQEFTESTTRRPALRRDTARVSEFFLEADDDYHAVTGMSTNPPGPRGSYEAAPTHGYGDAGNFSRFRSHAPPVDYSDGNESDDYHETAGPSSAPAQNTSMPEYEDSSDDGQFAPISQADKGSSKAKSYAIDSEGESDEDVKDREDVLDDYNRFKPKGSSNYINPYVAPPSPSISSVSDGEGDYIDDADDNAPVEDEGVEIVDEKSENLVNGDDKSDDEPYSGYVGVVGNDELPEDPDDYLNQFGFPQGGRKVKRWRHAKPANKMEIDEYASTPRDSDAEAGERSNGAYPAQEEAYWSAMKKAEAEWVPVPAANIPDDWTTSATKPAKSKADDLMEFS